MEKRQVARPNTRTLEPLSHAELARPFFTTGQVARLIGVANRTASKWIDTGQLVGYRIPGSKNRRVLREHLVEFMRAYGMPGLDGLLAVACPLRALLVGTGPRLQALQTLLPAGAELVTVQDSFDAGVATADDKPFDAVLCDAGSFGSLEARRLGVSLLRLGERTPPRRVLLPPDDGADCDWSGWSLVLSPGAGPAECAQAILQEKDRNGRVFG